MIRFGRAGSIVMIASMSGTVANRVGLTCCALGVRVNTISPGYVVTAMVDALLEECPERRESWPAQNMLGRLSATEEY
ncbi:NAD(P)-binding protein [Diplocarpon rosae]|nr:NAD(P)-binding protein [Diplocarpon rosae]